MKSNIINIGNSKGIIIPSKFLKLIGIKKTVDIQLKENKLIISPIKRVIREDWEEMIINEVKNNGQPEKLIPDFFENEKAEDWTW